MCIIAVSPKGKELPSYETREHMWRRNPDGAGIMYTRNGYVEIEKGFMTFSAMERRISELAREIDLTDTPVIMHYRITTHGGTCPELTHPFPLTSSARKLRSTHIRTNFGIAHNGIIPIQTTPGMSDTSEYIADVLCELPKGFEQDRAIRDRIAHEISGSRMVFLDGYGHITRIGTWHRDNGGCWYSNTGYIIPPAYDTLKWAYTGSERNTGNSSRSTKKRGKSNVAASQRHSCEEATLRYYEDGFYDPDDDDVAEFLAWLKSRKCPWD